MLVSPTLKGEIAFGHQTTGWREDGGGQAGRPPKQVVAGAQMAALVGEQHAALFRVEGADHGGADDDATGAAGQGDGEGVVAAHDGHAVDRARRRSAA